MSPAAKRELTASLLAALAYFDVFDYPLTLLELKRYRFMSPGRPSGREPSLAELQECLGDSPARERDGFYFLPGRERLVTMRLARQRTARVKLIKVRRLARCLRFLPTVRFLAVCNSLAYANAERDADIDLFLVVRSGMVWLTRLIVAGALALLGLRPTAATRRDRFCLSFIVGDRSLDLRRLRLEPDDPYFHFWLATLRPVLDRDRVAARLWRANRWLSERLPGAIAPRQVPLERTGSEQVHGIRFKALTAWLETAARRLQEALFPMEIISLANRDTRVVATDDVLKFHVNDRRAEIGAAYRERLRTLRIAL